MRRYAGAGDSWKAGEAPGALSLRVRRGASVDAVRPERER